MSDKIKLNILKIWKHKFKILLFIFISFAIIFGISIFSFLFFNENFFNIDLENKSQLLGSFGIIISALIASFAVLTNIEITKNNEEYKNLKYIQIQFMLLNQYIEFAISWVDKFQVSNEKAKNENIRLEEFLNEIYNIRKELVSKENSFIYKRNLFADLHISTIITTIEEIYHFKNAYGLNKSTYHAISESLSSLNLISTLTEQQILKRLDIFENDFS